MLWRRFKISELNAKKFKQEYPASVEEAFEYSEDGTFFDRDIVRSCAQPKLLNQVTVGARVGAIDPAGDGINSDRSAIGYGDDLAIRDLEYWENLDVHQLAKRAEDYIDKHNLEYFWVDSVGLGAGVYATMKHGRHKMKVKSFKGSGTTSTMIDGKEVYENRRAEAYGRLRDWMDDGDSVQIPDSIELIDDICGPLEMVNEKTGKVQIESKKDMKKRGIRSPDGLDVCAMIKCEKLRNNLTNPSQYDTVTTSYNVLDLGL
jgi:hypothetical protein